MALRKIDFLGRPKPPCADHQEPSQAHKDQPWKRDPPILIRYSIAEMHTGGEQSGCSRNRHTYEIFSAWTPGISRLRIRRDVEACQPRRPTQKEQKADKCAR